MLRALYGVAPYSHERDEIGDRAVGPDIGRAGDEARVAAAPPRLNPGAQGRRGREGAGADAYAAIRSGVSHDRGGRS
jgi:hypothetical protein